MSVEEVASMMRDMAEKDSIPSNVSDMLEDAAEELEEEDKDLSVRVNTASSLLDQVSNDPNIRQHTRTEVWNLASKVESLN
ncbi:hypothetical protein HRED_01309 [Candidatus Haloredivivus sp. G17]|jgi:uncharacterized protein (UPF0147 family)|nr:hypothetical protein HRED_01309 [Candidatus Haloredivivus sp. G17]